jgi:hypothetical protein
VLVTGAGPGQDALVALLPEAAHVNDDQDGGVIWLHPQTFAVLGLATSEVPACVLHRPITPAARAEAARLLQGDPGPVADVPLRAAWIDGGDAEEITAGLIEAATSGATAHLTSAGGLLLAGVGPVAFPPDTPTRQGDPSAGLMQVPRQE